MSTSSKKNGIQVGTCAAGGVAFANRDLCAGPLPRQTAAAIDDRQFEPADACRMDLLLRSGRVEHLQAPIAGANERGPVQRIPGRNRSK